VGSAITSKIEVGGGPDHRFLSGSVETGPVFGGVPVDGAPVDGVSPDGAPVDGASVDGAPVFGGAAGGAGSPDSGAARPVGAALAGGSGPVEGAVAVDGVAQAACTPSISPTTITKPMFALGQQAVLVEDLGTLKDLAHGLQFFNRVYLYTAKATLRHASAMIKLGNGMTVQFTLSLTTLFCQNQANAVGNPGKQSDDCPHNGKLHLRLLVRLLPHLSDLCSLLALFGIEIFERP